ncbi:carbohydrate sulfotransferase 3-like [Palaemon carinicauda]|uniref:carbohydrate sulfotransferase 3-like n=1 Tax=Palaemon carinicauda TaxID=392227 RepID=UPI0035B69853
MADGVSPEPTSLILPFNGLDWVKSIGGAADLHLGTELGEKDKILGKGDGGFPYNILLLGSMGRSGLTFLASLFKPQPDVFYVVEPLREFGKRKLLTQKTAQKSLKDIFTCDIKALTLSSFQRDPTFFIEKVYNNCGHHSSCLTREGIKLRCILYSIRVVNTIKMRVAWIRPILNNAKVNLKVIHIVRDPRASLISAWQRGWNIPADTSCDNMAADLQNALKLKRLHPKKYLAVRYEDLRDNPWGLAKKIFAFLGYHHLPPTTIDFLKTTTSNDTDPFGTSRNTGQKTQAWRSVITADQLRMIETACKPAINKIGFRLFGNIEDVRNQSVPLYKKRYENTLFVHDDSS